MDYCGNLECAAYAVPLTSFCIRHSPPPELRAQKKWGRDLTSVVFSPESGNGLVAACDIPSGTAVVQELPYALALDLSFTTKVCLNCGTMRPGKQWGEMYDLPIQCEGCSAACWCSPDCHKANLSIHSLYCSFVLPLLRAVKSVNQTIKDPEMQIQWDEATRLRLLLVTLTLRYKEQQLAKQGKLTVQEKKTGQDQIWGQDISHADVLAQEDNVQNYPLSSRVRQLLPLWAQILRQVLPIEMRVPALELERLVCSDECNSFTFWLPDYTSYGRAVAPYAALLNHSCVPNACKSLLGPKFLIQVLATRDIKKGEPITFSYLASDSKLEERKQHLRDFYCFSCTCPRCRGDVPDKLPSSVACKCGGWMVDSQQGRVCCMCQKESITEDKTNECDGDEEDFADEGDYEGDEGDEGDEGEGNDPSLQETFLHQTNMRFHNKYTCKCGGWRFLDHGRSICVLCDK